MALPRWCGPLDHIMRASDGRLVVVDLFYADSLAAWVRLDGTSASLVFASKAGARSVSASRAGLWTGDYVVTINDRRCVVWTPEDQAEDRASAVATVRPLATINDLLAEAGALPRLFTLYTGSNEGLAWLLDPRIVAAMADSGLINAYEVPTLASHV